MKKNTTELSIVVGFAVAVVLLSMAGWLMYNSLKEYRTTLSWIDHSHQVLDSMHEMSLSMRELESGQRGYVITSNTAFSEESKLHQANVRSSVMRIQQLTIDNPEQQQRTAVLLQVAEDRLKLLEELVGVYHSQGFAAVRKLIGSDVNRNSMEALRKQTTIMEEVERTLLMQRSDKAEQNARYALKVGFTLVVVSLTGLLFLWWLVKRESQKLHAAEKAVHESEQMKEIFDLLQEKNVELESARANAEKANLAKSEFLSSMSHELRSPLNAILGFAQLMETDEPPPTAIQKESIAQILQAGWHLLALINEILDLAKVESRQTPLSNEPVSMAEIMLECQGMILQQAQQRDIRLVFPVFDAPVFVMADRTRVKQVLINLLSNAIKYNSTAGLVEVKCSESRPGRILVSVTDSGPGLRPEQTAQLFQAFNRLGQEAGGEEGTGIGLVVAKRLIELMGGIIGADSTVGVGSVFWFELVAADEPLFSLEECDATAPLRLHIPLGEQQQTVLYIEDNPANLKLVEQIIARHPDIHLLTALNGNSGIEIARASLPDVILMDINLPGINGLEAMKIIRSSPSTAHIPVVALSANAMPLDIERGLKAGFFSYLTKPIKVNELMDTLAVALASTTHGKSRQE